jgi:hypothetical protein
MVEVISKLQAKKYAANIYPGWVSISDIQKELGYLPRQDIQKYVLGGQIKAVNTNGGVCYCIEGEPLKYNEEERLPIKKQWYQKVN